MRAWTPAGGLATIAGISLIGAPLAMLVGDAGFAVGGGFVWTIPLWAAFYLFVPAMLALGALTGFTATALWGVGVGVFGSLIGTTIMGLERAAWSMQAQGIDDETVGRVLMEPAVFLTSRAPGLAFPVGLVLLAVAGARAGVLTRGAAVALGVGALLFPAGRIAFGPAVNVVGDAFMLTALAPLGWRLARTGRHGGG